MPIYEYRCGACDAKFEELVRSPGRRVECPRCRSASVKKLFSTFGVGSGGAPVPGPRAKGECESAGPGCGSCEFSS